MWLSSSFCFPNMPRFYELDFHSRAAVNWFRALRRRGRMQRGAEQEETRSRARPQGRSHATMFLTGTVVGSSPTPGATSERVTLVPIFYFIKNPSPAPLFLLFRKRSRSARLLGCKRPRDGSLSLPTFYGCAFGVGHFFLPGRQKKRAMWPLLLFVFPICLDSMSMYFTAARLLTGSEPCAAGGGCSRGLNRKKQGAGQGRRAEAMRLCF